MMNQPDKITALIIDDEPDAIEVLTDVLTEVCPQVEVVGKATSAIEGLKAIDKLKPQLLFLDVQMPRNTGFDVLRNIKDKQLQTIFVSAHANFAVQAVEFHAMAYLLKPVGAIRLIEAVNKAQEAIENAASNSYDGLLYNVSAEAVKRIAIPTGTGQRYFELDELIRITADNSYSNVFTTESPKPIVVSKNLKQFESMLGDRGFHRVHKTHLVNAQHIREYYKQEGGGIVLSDGYSIPFGRHYKESVLDLLKAMSFSV